MWKDLTCLLQVFLRRSLMRQQRRTGNDCLPCSRCYSQLGSSGEGETGFFHKHSWTWPSVKKQCGVTTRGRKGIRTTSSRGWVREMSNGRLLRGKEHSSETESWLKAELLKCQKTDPQRIWVGPGRLLNLLDCKARLREGVYCYLMFLWLIYQKLLLSVPWW